LALDDSPLLAVIDKLRRREKEAEKARRRRALVKATRRSTQHPLMEGGSSSGGGRLQAQHKASRVHPVASSVSAEGHGSDRPRRRVRAKRSWSSPPLGRATSVPLALGPGSRGAGNSEVVVLGSNDLRMISLTALSEDNLCSSSSGTGDGEQRWEKTFGGERISVLESVVESSHLPATSSLSPLSEPTNIRIPSLSPHPIDSVKFDVLQIPTIPHLAHGVRVVFEASGLVDRFQVSQKVLSSFVASVIDGYLPQAPESAGGGPRYHNAFHGADVLHTVWRFQLLIGAQHLFGPAERFGGSSSPRSATTSGTRDSTTRTSLPPSTRRRACSTTTRRLRTCTARSSSECSTGGREEKCCRDSTRNTRGPQPQVGEIAAAAVVAAGAIPTCSLA